MPPSDTTRSTTRSRIGYTFWTGAGAVAEETVFGRDGDFAITGDEVAAGDAVATGAVSFCAAGVLSATCVCFVPPNKFPKKPAIAEPKSCMDTCPPVPKNGDLSWPSAAA